MAHAYKCDKCGVYFDKKVNPSVTRKSTSFDSRYLTVITLVILDDLSNVETYDDLNYEDYHIADICPVCMVEMIA